MAKIRVSNAKKQPVRVVLEPWALEWMLNPDDYLDFLLSRTVHKTDGLWLRTVAMA